MMINNVRIGGKIVRNGVLSYEKDGEKFYEILLKAESNNTMIICSVTISENLLKNVENCMGERICVVGYLHNSCAYESDEKLKLTVFAQNIADSGDLDECMVTLRGIVCKPVIVQTTDNGKTFAKTVISIKHAENHIDYIPIITDDQDLTEMQSLMEGDRIGSVGVLWSTQHKKEISPTEMYIITDVADKVFASGFVKL